MKKLFYSLLTAAFVSVAAVCVQAAEVTSDAVVVNVSGSAKALLPGKPDAMAIKAGDKLPQGTVITTEDASEVTVQVFTGTSATIKGGTTVGLEKLSLSSDNGILTKQSAMLDLKVGSVLSKLDPKKKSVNDYSVRTPKGVAAARGTIFQVDVARNGTTRAFVTTGVVTFKSGNKEVAVQPGFIVIVDENGNIGEPVKATDSQLREIAEASEKNKEKYGSTGDDVNEIDPNITVSPGR
ncbi:MAG: FecR domain-containing protein [Opitutaceae bacterium]